MSHEQRRDDGGSAFPGICISSPGEYASAPGGMSLRDYFAAQVLANLTRSSGEDWSVDAIAADCYRQADAMLRQRALELKR